MAPWVFNFPQTEAKWKLATSLLNTDIVTVLHKIALNSVCNRELQAVELDLWAYECQPEHLQAVELQTVALEAVELLTISTSNRAEIELAINIKVCKAILPGAQENYLHHGWTLPRRNTSSTKFWMLKWILDRLINSNKCVFQRNTIYHREKQVNFSSRNEMNREIFERTKVCFCVNGFWTVECIPYYKLKNVRPNVK